MSINPQNTENELADQKPKGPAPDYSKTTGGGAQLAKAMGAEAQAHVARKLEVSPAFFNHLIHGRKFPGRKLAIRIRDKYGVPIDAW